MGNSTTSIETIFKATFDFFERHKKLETMMSILSFFISNILNQVCYMSII